MTYLLNYKAVKDASLWGTQSEWSHSPRTSQQSLYHCSGLQKTSPHGAP